MFESGTQSEALLLERFIKKQKSKKLIEKIFDPEFIPKGKLAQLVRVPQVREPAEGSQSGQAVSFDGLFRFFRY